MDHDYIRHLKEHNPSIKLLKADNAPLIISFLFLAFKSQHKNTLANNELLSLLSDYLYSLRQLHGERVYPDTAQHYLNAWANDHYLRKYYPPNSDEPVFEMTPGTEKALDWIRDLDRKEFIGTESRLLHIFSMLKEIVSKSLEDPEERIADLEKQKQQIEQEIQKVRAGQIDRLNPTRIRERYFEVEDTAHKLLSDFRQVEYNFRDLDTAARKNIIESDLSKGRLLEVVFKDQDFIWESDQGKSFLAFWEFLMSQDKQDELNKLINAVGDMPEIQGIKQERFMERLKVNLIEAGDKVYKTNSLLIEQLRKFLDDKAYLENKRIMDLIREIEGAAIRLKDHPPKEKNFLEIETKASLDFIMERPLFTPPKNPVINEQPVEEGSAEVDMATLYEQLYINPEELKANIREILRENEQVSLKQLIEKYPVKKGLSELIAYFSVATKDPKAMIREEKMEKIIIFNDKTARFSEVELPQTIFSR
jgi:hypothetical protein